MSSSATVFGPIATATMRARKRTGLCICTELSQGHIRVVHVADLNPGGSSTIVVLSDWMSLDECPAYLDGLHSVSGYEMLAEWTSAS